MKLAAAVADEDDGTEVKLSGQDVNW